MGRLRLFLAIVLAALLSAGCIISLPGVGELLIVAPLWSFTAEDGTLYFGLFDTIETKTVKEFPLTELPVAPRRGGPVPRDPDKVDKNAVAAFKTSIRDEVNINRVVGESSSVIKGKLTGDFLCEVFDDESVRYKGSITLRDDTNKRDYRIKGSEANCLAADETLEPARQLPRKPSR